MGNLQLYIEGHNAHKQNMWEMLVSQYLGPMYNEKRKREANYNTIGDSVIVLLKINFSLRERRNSFNYNS
jgi:hypothetical protein